MFDVWKNLDLMHKNLALKNMLSSGRRLFETNIDNLNIKVVVGYNNSLESQKHIHENRFYLRDMSIDDSYKEYTFVDFVKCLQEEDKFDEFKWRLEEKLIVDI